MRIVACDHCGKQETIIIGNRRPLEWCTVRTDLALDQHGPRHSVDRKTHQYELCEVCAKDLFVFLSKATP